MLAIVNGITTLCSVFLYLRTYIYLFKIVCAYVVLWYIVNAIDLMEEGFKYLNIPIVPELVMYWIYGNKFSLSLSLSTNVFSLSIGWLLFFFGLGIIGIFLGLMWFCGALTCCTAPKTPYYHTYNYGNVLHNTAQHTH